jgi:hypothetical protein
VTGVERNKYLYTSCLFLYKDKEITSTTTTTKNKKKQKNKGWVYVLYNNSSYHMSI